MAGQPKTRAKRESATEAAEQAAAGREAEAQESAGQSAARDAPPRRKRAPRSTDSRPAPGVEQSAPDRRPVKLRKIHDGLVQLFTLAGLGVGMFVDEYDGQVLVLNADRNARAWSDLAAQSPAVAKALEALLMGSAWGAAIGTTAMTALPIMVRHQVLPPEALAIAAGQGVSLPMAPAGAPRDQPEQAPPMAFTPGAPAPAQPTEAGNPQRHPMDGSATTAPAADPTAPAFPHPESEAA